MAECELVRYQAGVLAVQERRFADAARLLESMHPTPELQAWLALTYAGLGDFKQATQRGVDAQTYGFVGGLGVSATVARCAGTPLLKVADVSSVRHMPHPWDIITAREAGIACLETGRVADACEWLTVAWNSVRARQANWLLLGVAVHYGFALRCAGRDGQACLVASAALVAVDADDVRLPLLHFNHLMAAVNLGQLDLAKQDLAALEALPNFGNGLLEYARARVAEFCDPASACQLYTIIQFGSVFDRDVVFHAHISEVALWLEMGEIERATAALVAAAKFGGVRCASAWSSMRRATLLSLGRFPTQGLAPAIFARNEFARCGYEREAALANVVLAAVSVKVMQGFVSSVVGPLRAAYTAAKRLGCVPVIRLELSRHPDLLAPLRSLPRGDELRELLEDDATRLIEVGEDFVTVNGVPIRLSRKAVAPMLRFFLDRPGGATLDEIAAFVGREDRRDSVNHFHLQRGEIKRVLQGVSLECENRRYTLCSTNAFITSA